MADICGRQDGFISATSCTLIPACGAAVKILHNTPRSYINTIHEFAEFTKLTCMPPDTSCSRSLPSPSPSCSLSNSHAVRACRDPSCTANLRGSLCQNIARTIQLCSCSPQDLHVRVLFDRYAHRLHQLHLHVLLTGWQRRTIRRIWRRCAGSECLQAHAGQSAILQ